MKVLVIDVGGNNVKLMLSGHEEVRKFPSGRKLSAGKMASQALETANGWSFDAVSLGVPAPVAAERPAAEPKNLGDGWTDFDYAKAFGKPVKLLNDAALQALGSYRGGRMLFLGLGTSLGSTLIVDNIVVPLELGQLPHDRKRSFEDSLGDRGFKKLGAKRWRAAVAETVDLFSRVFVTDYVVLGGGNAKELKKLPEGAVRGDNRNVLLGGERLWNDPPWLTDAGASGADVK